MERKYETMMIVKPDLADNEKEEVFDKIIKKVEGLEGKVTDSKVWAKERNFYYFIKGRDAEKKKYHKGCYWLANFTLDKDKLGDLKETIRLEERILRNIIINREGKEKIVSAKQKRQVPSGTNLRSDQGRRS